MNTCLVIVTHHRLAYTRKCVEHVLADTQSDFDLYFWDNASSDETPDYLKSLKDPRIKDVVLSKENAGQTIAMNRLWNASKAELVAKLDNDCLPEHGWLQTFAAAHRDIKNLGAVACWHYRKEDFYPEVAHYKIREINGHKIFQHPWVCGSGFVMKRETYLKRGPWPEGSPDIGTTDYFMDLALAGFINGWYYPLILQEHMDDPLSPHCLFDDDASLLALKEISYTLRVQKIKTYSQRLQRRKIVVDTLHYSPWNARAYQGWLGKARQFMPSFDRWRWQFARFSLPCPPRS
jgi:glycosyltransferase involved in cell wall biosynthesis